MSFFVNKNVCFLEQGEQREGKSCFDSCRERDRGHPSEEEEGSGGFGRGRSGDVKREKGQPGSNCDNRRRGQLKDIRTLVLKQQCIISIKNIITKVPVTLLTRDAVVKLPTSLLMEVYE